MRDLPWQYSEMQLQVQLFPVRHVKASCTSQTALGKMMRNGPLHDTKILWNFIDRLDTINLLKFDQPNAKSIQAFE